MILPHGTRKVKHYFVCQTINIWFVESLMLFQSYMWHIQKFGMSRKLPSFAYIDYTICHYAAVAIQCIYAFLPHATLNENLPSINLPIPLHLHLPILFTLILAVLLFTHCQLITILPHAICIPEHFNHYVTFHHKPPCHTHIIIILA